MNGCTKSPDAAFGFVSRRCGARQGTPCSSRFARLARGTGGAVPAREALCPLYTALPTLKPAAPPVPEASCRRFRRFVLLAALFLVLSGCAALPTLKPLDPSLEPAVLEACRRPFLTEKYRLVHALTAVMPGGREGQAIGILLADPANRIFRSVLMTIEGVVLVDIESGKVLAVNRAVPPFEAPAFAQRMAEDVSLAFFSPGGEPLAWGRDEGGGVACRFARPGGEVVDVIKSEDGAMEIRLYGAGQELRKKVSIPHLERPGLAEELEIRGTAWWPSYGLRMRLIEAEPVGP